MRPTVFMLVGLPCTGKSTILRKLMVETAPTEQFFHYSTDDYVESMAVAEDLSYDHAFKKYYDESIKILNRRLDEVIKRRGHVIWDQTNLYAAARIKKLRRFPKSYLKIAIYTPIENPVDLVARMKEVRPNKIVPLNVMEDMHDKYVYPELSEGFDEIFTKENALNHIIRA